SLINTYTVTSLPAGPYTFNVIDANGCTSSASATLVDPTVLTASATFTEIMCNGGTSTVTVTAAGGTPAYSGTGTFNELFGSHTYTITDSHGCIDTDLVRIAVASDAILDAGQDATIYPGETVELSPTGNCSFFSWFPNYHLTDNNIKNPIASPPVTTKYIVSATTEFGCEVSDSITVFVSPETILDLPNAFSPGSGTSINDELKIIVKGIATLKFFRVYNRWGQLIFETTDINKGWNGQFNGVPQPLGTYVYLIDAVTSSGRKFYKQGNVTLIR
ncbi:MAG TPA: gliding motility-associated C-terminal domain-containing protein, partial [Chitinophagaceae bacterium]|nr:gliding motility-associated C-terminal domain-containing protein [Chitinophagaceae bacterium]